MGGMRRNLTSGSHVLIPSDSSLVRSHIKDATNRSPHSYRSLLSSDLQGLISSGMLTLKAKLETVVDQAKWLARLAEVWQFYFGIMPVSWAARGGLNAVLIPLHA